MQIIWCLGGLGNQMFQYAFYRSLELDGRDVYLDISEFSNYNLHQGFELTRIFKIKPKIVDIVEVRKLRFSFFARLLRKLAIYNSEVNQVNFGYDAKYLNFIFSKYLIGYWQSEKYFVRYQQQIRKDFTFPEFEGTNQNFAEIALKTESVALHIRLGDYIGHKLLGGICTLEYYQRAIEYIRQHLFNPKFLIFSNDLEWCKANLNLQNAVFINGNDGKNSYKDMQLMSLCKHNIIANSSFSWWGAWLNNNPSKLVIAPQKWFNDISINTSDLLPETWVKI